jgi:hypothetical protein
MRKMSLSKDLQQALAIFISVLLFLSILAYAAVTPLPSAQFFQLYALGEDGMTENYYPDGNATIPLSTEVKWFLGVTNYMDSLQYVALKVKLGNLTSAKPDETRFEPAPLPSLVEFRKVLSKNETWELPFTWAVNDVQVVGDIVYVRNLTINEEQVSVSDIGAQQGQNVRMVFELWSYNSNQGDFIFGWYAGEERRCAWLQLWFNVTSPDLTKFAAG